MNSALTRLEDDTNHVLVGVGEIACAGAGQVLITRALGSCVGVTLWDPRLNIAGMAHVMLPAAPERVTGRRQRFADLAIPDLLEQLQGLGVSKRRLVAKIAGGSSMFKGESGIDSIGDRNVAAVLEQLEAQGISVRAADTGGSHARTIELRLDTGVLLVRSYAQGMREI